MVLFKRGTALIAGIFILLNNAFPAFSQEKNSSEQILKQAAKKRDDPSTGISLTRSALVYAEKENNKSVIIRSLNLEAQFWGSLKKFDSARIYANKALTEADNYHLDSLKGDCWYTLGTTSFSNNELKQSIAEYNKALAQYQKFNQLAGIGTSYLGIGISEQGLTDYTNAIGHYLRAAEIFHNLNDQKYLAYTYNSLADCFNQLKEYPKTLEYNRYALAIRRKLKDADGISQSLNNLGFLFYKLEKADSAIYYLSKSLELIKNDKDSTALILTLQDISSAYKIKHEFKKAERYSLRAQNIAAKYSMSKELAGGNADLAEIYLRQNEYPRALTHVDRAIDTAQKLNLKELLLKAYTIKYEIYKETGDYKNAVLFADKKAKLNDDLYKISSKRLVTEMETKYKTAKAEKDVAVFKVKNEMQGEILSQQTMYIIVLGFAAVLLAVLFVIAYNNFRKKNKANQRIQTLMRDLHHRVKNNLQILQGLFSMQIDNLSDEKTKNALRENEARLTSMNLIHSRLYLDNTTTKIEMGDYLTKLLNHIKDSFGEYGQNEVNLKIEVSNIMLEADKAVAIGLIANELTTNSFKYAFNGAGGEIHLALQLIEKSKILLTLGDNGVGLKPENKDKAPSFGLKLVNLMARQLNSTLVVKSNPGVFYQMEISI